MPYVNIPDSNLAPTIGKVVGRMKGELTSRVQSQVDEITQEFLSENICSNQTKLNSISKKKDNIQSNLLKFQRRIDALRKTATALLVLTSAFKIIINIIKALPIPCTPFVTVGVNTTFSDKLHQAKELVKQIEEDVESILRILTGAVGVLALVQGILSKLNVIDQALQECSTKGVIDRDDFNRQIRTGGENTNELDNIDQENDSNSPGRSTIYFSEPNNRNFQLILREVEDTSLVAPLRFVEVRDVSTNKVVFQGEKSYSAEAKILFEEIKFKIDTELI